MGAKNKPKNFKTKGGSKGSGQGSGRGGDYASSNGKDWHNFNSQLAPFGLKLKLIAADGNCLFRSIADQKFGDIDQHLQLRADCMEFLEKNESDYAPFLEMPIEDYCKKMRKECEWAGHLELVALSKMCNADIIIHQFNAPRLTIKSPNPTPDQSIHLAYHNGEHYSSVRNINDSGLGVPTPIILPSSTVNSSNEKSSNNDYQHRIITESTGCNNISKMTKLLISCWNDVAAVIDILNSEKEAGLDINIEHDNDDDERQPDSHNEEKQPTPSHRPSPPPRPRSPTPPPIRAPPVPTNLSNRQRRDLAKKKKKDKAKEKKSKQSKEDDWDGDDQEVKQLVDSLGDIII